MAVGMGSGVKKAELAKITNNHAYYASTFKELVSAAFIKKITGETCKVSKFIKISRTSTFVLALHIQMAQSVQET